MTPKKVRAPYDYSYTVDDLAKASKEWGCNCGPGALAAILNLKPDDVLAHIPHFKERGYTNPTMMMTALRSLKVPFMEMDDTPDRKAIETVPPEWLEECRSDEVKFLAVAKPECITPHCRLPRYGLVRVQWEGPWLNAGVPPAAAYRYTHWIGTLCGSDDRKDFYVFDVNVGWDSFFRWHQHTAPSLIETYKRATGGYRFTHRWELFDNL